VASRNASSGQLSADPLSCGWTVSHGYVVAVSAALLIGGCFDSRVESIPLEQTLLSAVTPTGFVHSPRTPIAGKTSLHFDPPEGTPGSPSISLHRLGEAPPLESLESYIARTVPPASKVLIGPRDVQVLGSRAIEIANEYTLIAYSDDGSIAADHPILHQIVFSYAGYYYACRLEVSPESRQTWIPAFQEFCSQIRAS
jgi:hypothetical protein